MEKEIILGLTGGIAVYKSAELCSLLTKSGYNVHVIMTDSAKQMISDRLFFTLSKNPVLSDLWTVPEWQPAHVSLAAKAKLFAVAPCTANFLGKYANGIADDALTTTALAYDGPVLLAPAMNFRMWKHPAVQHNVRVLKERGVLFAGPGKGHLACGEEGSGRMSEPAEIFKQIENFFKQQE